jgi:hypothetical protein
MSDSEDLKAFYFIRSIYLNVFELIEKTFRLFFFK